jgi:hypothetical protein
MRIFKKKIYKIIDKNGKVIETCRYKVTAISRLNYYKKMDRLNKFELII